MSGAFVRTCLQVLRLGTGGLHRPLLVSHPQLQVGPDASERDALRAACEPSARASAATVPAGDSGGSPSLPSLEPQVHLRAARELQQLGRIEEALKALRRCLYLDPSHREALALRATLAGELGRHEEADQLRRRLARTRSRVER